MAFKQRSSPLDLMAGTSNKKNKKQPNKPKYFYKLFDNIHLINASLQTLPKSFTKLLPDEKKHNKYSDELLTNIIDDLQEGEN